MIYNRENLLKANPGELVIPAKELIDTPEWIKYQIDKAIKRIRKANKLEIIV